MLARIVLSILLSLGFGFLTQPLHAQTVLDTVCAGARGVVYQVVDNPGSHFSWNVEGGFVANGDGTHAVSVDWGKDTGIFTIEVIQFALNGCPGDTVRAFVWIRPGISISIEGPKMICEGDEVVLHAHGSDKYVWNTGYRNAPLRIKPTASALFSVVGYSDYCGMDTAHFSLQVNRRPQAVIVVNPNIPKLNELVVLHADGSKDDDQFQWNINSGSIIKEGEQAEFVFPTTGNYLIQLIVIDSNGCGDTAQTSVLIEANPQVFIPNAFSPNGDGLNEEFAPVSSDISFIRLTIYDRWGEKIYTGENDEASWDATFKGNVVPEGVYVYHVEAIGIDKKKYNYNGTLTLVR